MLKVYADFRRFYVNIHELSKKKRKFDSLETLQAVIVSVSPDLVTDERHPPVMWPGEGGDRGAPVVDELDAPPPLVLDPDKDDPRGVAAGELLVRLVPLHHRHLNTDGCSEASN